MKRFKLSSPHNWLIFRIVNPQIEQALEKHARGELIDIGCGEKPYLQMAAPYVTKHAGVDHEDMLHDKSSVDLFGTAYAIPCDDESFDTVLCTYVLEHLEEPRRALTEAYRVLRPGGCAIYTVPLFWHIHEAPRDFYRFTRHGLAYLFERSGFEIVEIRAMSGFCVTFGQELVYFLYMFRKGGKLNPLWWIVPVLGHIIQAVALILSRFDRSESFTVEYIAIVRKPEGGVA